VQHIGTVIIYYRSGNKYYGPVNIYYKYVVEYSGLKIKYFGSSEMVISFKKLIFNLY